MVDGGEACTVRSEEITSGSLPDITRKFINILHFCHILIIIVTPQALEKHCHFHSCVCRATGGLHNELIMKLTLSLQF